MISTHKQRLGMKSISVAGVWMLYMQAWWFAKRSIVFLKYVPHNGYWEWLRAKLKGYLFVPSLKRMDIIATEVSVS